MKGRKSCLVIGKKYFFFCTIIQRNYLKNIQYISWIFLHSVYYSWSVPMIEITDLSHLCNCDNLTISGCQIRFSSAVNLAKIQKHQTHEQYQGFFIGLAGLSARDLKAIFYTVLSSWIYNLTIPPGTKDQGTSAYMSKKYCILLV